MRADKKNPVRLDYPLHIDQVFAWKDVSSAGTAYVLTTVLSTNAMLETEDRRRQNPRFAFAFERHGDAFPRRQHQNFSSQGVFIE